VNARETTAVWCVMWTLAMVSSGAAAQTPSDDPAIDGGPEAEASEVDAEGADEPGTTSAVHDEGDAAEHGANELDEGAVAEPASEVDADVPRRELDDERQRTTRDGSEDRTARRATDEERSDDGAVDVEGDAVEDEEDDGFDWMILPLAAASSDLGIGGALFAQLLWREPGERLERDRIFVVTSLTHLLFQAHGVTWSHRVPRRGLLLKTSLFFSANPELTYCGVGYDARCDGATADAVLAAAGIAPGSDEARAARDDLFDFRATYVTGTLGARWQPGGEDGSLALTFGWRGERTWTSFFGGAGPYQPSLYGRDRPDGEDGFDSNLETGVEWDERDHPLRTTQGYLVGLAVRGSHAYLGSDWDYLGVTLTASGHLPLDPRSRWIWASRFTGDVIVGEPNVRTLGRVGGPWAGPAFGGMSFGRGVEQGALIGRWKLVAQTELRGTFWESERSLAFGVQGFVDAGLVAEDRFALPQVRPDVGLGGGLNVRWADAFTIRLDLAGSPTRNDGLQFYLLLQEPF